MSWKRNHFAWSSLQSRLQLPWSDVYSIYGSGCDAEQCWTGSAVVFLGYSAWSQFFFFLQFSGVYTNVSTFGLVFSGVYSDATGCSRYSCQYNPLNPPTLSCPTGSNQISRNTAWTATIGGSTTVNTTTTYIVTGLGGTPNPLTINVATRQISLTANGTNNLPLGNVSYTIQMLNTAGFNQTVTCFVFVSPARFRAFVLLLFSFF